MIVTCHQMQQCEEAAFARGVSAAALMEEAGRGIADVVRQFAPRAGSLVLFLGKGNNAGDALVAARELIADGWKLHARLSSEPAAMKPLPRQHLGLLSGHVRILDDTATFDFPAGPIVSLDGLLGIGAQGTMKLELQVLAREMNTLRTQRHALTIAMDIPSGLDGDHGAACVDAVEADVTAVVAQMKAGLLADGADHYVGRIALVPLKELSQTTGDAQAEVLTPRLLRSWLPRLLTPHPGEMDRLLQNFPDWRGMNRRMLVESFTETAPGRTLLLKGTRTVIGTLGQPTLFNTTGHPGMASGGMGDVLSGVCVAFAAQHLKLHQAAGLGAWLCGRAAERFVTHGHMAMESVGASDVTAHLGGALQDLKDDRF